MKILSRLLPSALAALVACSANTDDLKPKTAAECGMLQKPCGYKCVSVLDPGSGCGGSSCEPCAGTFAFCDPSTYACMATGGTVCTGTQADCDGFGACEDLATDEGNCGACGHPCEGPSNACSAGVCGASSIPAGDSARGVAFSQSENALYWLDTSAGTGGRLVRWDASTEFSWTSLGWTVVAEGPSGPDPRPGSPGLFRIAANGMYQYPEVYLAGWRTGSGDDFTVFRWDGSALAPVAGDVYATTPGSVSGLAAMGPSVGFTRSDSAQPQVSDGTILRNATTGSLTPPYGMAGYGLSALIGYWGTGGGTLALIDSLGNETVLRDGLAVWPARVALYATGANPEYAWASEQDGSVWHWVDDGASEPVQIHAGTGVSTQMDLAMDVAGVYWMDRQAGEVWERRHDGTKFQLARGVLPNGIAIDATFVYFTDDSSGSGEVKRVPK